MQTLTQLADAARAVIAADRDGELTDDMINALELALNGAEQPPATEQSGEAVAPLVMDDDELDEFIISTADSNGYDMKDPQGVMELCRAVARAFDGGPQPAPALPEEFLNLVIRALHMQGCGDLAKELQAMLAAAPQPIQAAGPVDQAIYDSIAENYHQRNAPALCECHTCQPITPDNMRMVLCPVCGNKRCPHANDHRNACTGSNEPGQVGSFYTAAPQPAQPLPSVIEEIAAERRRQINVEGWTPEHDDQHQDYTLAAAAGCYAMHTLAYPAGEPPQPWPWDKASWKPSPDKRRNWIKAAALLVAAIEREDRMAAQKEGGE
ncbi:hypothetical protein [Chromobacterium violaceum]|uniref:hypothetical protein n=1 Tax=Chromobacterium violaceum TaxID=536 RepID=UPI00143D0E2B|nr:hypothetical protein [Chromobacterium violaceum]QIY77722.1 hypothetical protein FOB43_20850 [Chromobacterium violaceum]